MLMSSRKSFGLAVTLAASVVLAGCQGGAGLSRSSFGGGSSVAADSRLNSQAEQYEAKFFGKSGVTACIGGAAVGAATGALTGLLKGGDKGDIAKHAAIGGGAGCVAAMGANYYFETQKAKNANKEVQITASINDVKTLNAAITKDISNAKKVINEDKQTLASLSKQIKNKTVDLANAKKQLARVDANISKMKAVLASMQKQHKEFTNVAKQQKANGAKTAGLEKQIVQLNKQITEYDSLIASYSKQRTAIKVG